MANKIKGKRAEAAGILAGSEIELNQAVSKQDEIKMIGAQNGL